MVCGFSLESVEPESDEFKEVIGASGISNNSPIITEKIILERIVHPILEERFRTHENAICDRRSMPREEATVYPTYHGTSEKALENILENGFDYRYNRIANFGIGTYLARNCRDALPYTRLDRDGYQCILVCKVVVGRSKLGSMDEILDESEYDSFYNGFSEISCPYNDGILPLYLIRRKRERLA
jgi:hypothetical protein